MAPNTESLPDAESKLCLMQKTHHAGIAKGISEHAGNKVGRGNAYSLPRHHHHAIIGPKGDESRSSSSPRLTTSSSRSGGDEEEEEVKEDAPVSRAKGVASSSPRLTSSSSRSEGDEEEEEVKVPSSSSRSEGNEEEEEVSLEEDAPVSRAKRVTREVETYLPRQATGVSVEQIRDLLHTELDPLKQEVERLKQGQQRSLHEFRSSQSPTGDESQTSSSAKREASLSESSESDGSEQHTSTNSHRDGSESSTKSAGSEQHNSTINSSSTEIAGSEQHNSTNSHLDESEQDTPDLHALLPEPILALAWTVFKTSDAIADIVENSVLVNLTHGGIKMAVRMHKEDDAVKRLGEEGNWMSYDLDKLDDAGDKSTGMLNMIDIGGNYGVITIAAMKKYKKRLRVVTVEPAPRTFFFLKWNLYLNNIAEIDRNVLEDEETTPGVLALNSGTSDVEDQDLRFCFYKDSSMNSKICDCENLDDGCIIVPSITVDKLARMFGTEKIAMVKMDCEGCEFQTLPALSKSNISKRVQHLAGELHLPDQNLEMLACRWDEGRHMSKCQRSPSDENNIECGVSLTCPE